jgi:diaminopropionate ammonia-lyase
MAGYSTIFYEMEKVVNFEDHCEADVILLQAGVGGMAAAGTWYYRTKYGMSSPKIVCVEPILADSFLESAKHGQPRESQHNYRSIMAGLNCGVSLAAFPILRDAANAFISISDHYAEDAMRAYARGLNDDPVVVSGESGASGLAGLLALVNDEKLRKLAEYLELNKNSKILLINTEADTDPENYRRIVSMKQDA